MVRKTGTTTKEAKTTASGGYRKAARAMSAIPASLPATERIARGGVSPIPAKAAAYGLTALVEQQGPITAAAAHPNFSFHGGPVIKRPQVFSSFWGQSWSQAANKERANRLNQYLRDLLKSKYMNILSQYGVGAGAGAAGAFIKSSFIANVSGSLRDGDIRQIIQSGINNGVFPEPANPTNNVLVIFLGEGISVNEPAQGLILCEPAHDTAFGYHSFFTTVAGNPFYYSIIPALDNQCLTQTCPSDAGCSLHLAETQEQRQTQVASHEFAEMTTDPELNAWFDGSSGAENGDICNGESGTIQVEGRTWTVQRMYSKFDDVQSNGAAKCRTEPPNPLPRLSPGPPFAQPFALADAQQMQTVDQLLPLPTAYFDPQTGQAAMDEAELLEYVKRVFSPFSDEHIITDLPAFLREAADILSKG
ncbi:MAG: hypothetical protein QOH25_32 [Acidobacteriota bacterium]|nr:hypothetical protein [Acidobacteriota bacterium]